MKMFFLVGLEYDDHQLFPALKQGKSLPSHLPSFTSKSSHCLSNKFLIFRYSLYI